MTLASGQSSPERAPRKATNPTGIILAAAGAATRNRELPGIDIRCRQSDRPFVTVAIPAYNQPQFLEKALDSIAAQESFDDFEVVVCDDLGLSETRAVVRRCVLPRVRYVRNPQRLGPVRNWNRCLELAEGRWTTILHEDDLLYPWYFASVIPHLRREWAAVAMKCLQSATPTAAPRPTGPGRWRAYAPEYFLKSAMTPFPGVLFSTDLARAIGGFDECLGPLADYAFWYRLACAGRIEVLSMFGVFYRVHAGQWTAEAWPEMIRKMHLLRLRIAREQMPAHPRLGRWLARFFTYRNALAYAERFASRPDSLSRACRFGRIPMSGIPSGWVWALLRAAGRRTRSPAGGLMRRDALATSVA